MRTLSLPALSILALLCGGCSSAPAQFEGELAGRPFTVRSSVLAPPQRLGGNAPPGRGMRLLFTDYPELCDFARRVRAAEARGEAPPQREAGEFTTVEVTLYGEQVAAGVAPPDGTYRVYTEADGPGVFLPLAINARFTRLRDGVLRAEGIASSGTVELSGATLHQGAESQGQLQLEFSAPQAGSLRGEFTATYCEYI